MRALLLFHGEVVDADLLATLRDERLDPVEVHCARVGSWTDLAAFDLVLFDGIPSPIGVAAVASLRARLPLVPIVAFQADPSVDDRVRYLDAGADHCMPRTFDPAELRARVQSLQRRYPHGVLRLGPFRWNWRDRAAVLDAVPIPLSPIETVLLEELLKAFNRVAPLRVLTARIDPCAQGKASTRLHVYISRLRKRLVGTGLRIQSANRRGYALVFERDSSDATTDVPAGGRHDERAPRRPAALASDRKAEPAHS